MNKCIAVIGGGVIPTAYTRDFGQNSRDSDIRLAFGAFFFNRNFLLCKVLIMLIIDSNN
jgi:hypothetical protein